MNDRKKIYIWNGLNWSVEYDDFDNLSPIALCPNQKCNCKLKRQKRENYYTEEYEYHCIRCNFKIILNKSIEEKGIEFLDVYDSLKYKDAEIVNIDGELIRVQRNGKKDEDYWIDVKISKNKKNELQLMVLAGSKKSKDKTQLFLDPKNERLAFDQNNDHPQRIFTKVIGIFKNSKSEIHSKG